MFAFAPLLICLSIDSGLLTSVGLAYPLSCFAPSSESLNEVGVPLTTPMSRFLVA